MLSRNKIYHKVEPDKVAKKIFIFCEGDREVNYFSYFKGFSTNIDIIPIPNNDGQSDPLKLYYDAVLKIIGTHDKKPELLFQKDSGDEVWFSIDTDRWNDGNKISILRQNCTLQFNWVIAQSNPSFEIWLYYHFHSALPNENEIKSCLSFKEFVNNKIPGGFNSQKHPLKFQDAIFNSENNFLSQNNQPAYLSTEVFRLAKSILPFIKDALDQCIALQHKI